MALHYSTQFPDIRKERVKELVKDRQIIAYANLVKKNSRSEDDQASIDALMTVLKATYTGPELSCAFMILHGHLTVD